MSSAARAQTLLSTPAHPVMLADRGPVFYAVSAGGHADRLDAAHTAGLARRIALRLDDASVPDALRAIEEKTGLRFAFDRAALASAATVTLHADDITVAAALTQVLFDANVDVDLGSAGLASIRLRRAVPQAAQQQTGTIEGRVTDSSTAAPIRYATILIVGTKHGATTGDNGEYRILNVRVGTYTLVARVIGYAPTRKTVNVSGDQPITAHFSLAKAPNELQRIVTVGTVAPTEQKAIPTPITVVSDSAITDQQPWSLTQIIQQNVPTAVAITYFTNPQSSGVSTRGASTLITPNGVMKIYIDGIEAADQNNAPVDPNSIEHIEVIRGPEAATIYGSDAIDGVIEIFTKHGATTLTHPDINAQTGLGLIQSAYPGYRGALRQDVNGSVEGGSSTASYGVGGSYTHNGPWTPEGQSALAGAWGAFHATQGSLSLDFTGRYYETHSPEAVNPALIETGLSYFAGPFYHEWDTRNQTFGAHLLYTTTKWWQQSLTIGVDRVSADGRQTQPRFTTPADTFLLVEGQEEVKNSIAYNSSFNIAIQRNLSATLVTGVDHYERLTTIGATTGATSTTGALSSPGGAPSLTRDPQNNTGYFAQGTMAWHDQLFVTLGVRAEQNSSFGAAVGTPVSQRLGASFVQNAGATTLKMRASFGEAIAPPAPFLADGSITPPFTQLANPLLGPQRQRGWDAGADWVIGRAATLSATYYDQDASDLIEVVNADSTGLVTQNQNVGRVRNIGAELEGTLNVGRFEFRGQYGYTQARIGALGSSYTGDLRVGEQAFATPYNSGGASVAASPFATTRFVVGVSYVGAMINYDYAAEFSCFGGAGPCAASTRGYLARYPAFARVNISVTQQLWRAISAYLSIDNATNTNAFQATNLFPIEGRVTMVGLRFRY
jgi:outer membrane receptor protein involved in Fe transport